jgi:hypothetical protein
MNNAEVHAYNVSFGRSKGPPPNSYGAAGRAGIWNSVGLLEYKGGSSDDWERFPLVNLAGHKTGAQLYMYGLEEVWLADLEVPHDDGGVDHGPLMNKMIVSNDDPWDACVWIEKLPEGDYEILTYAMLMQRLAVNCVRVDKAEQGPMWIGSSEWPGKQVINVTYARHTTSITHDNDVIGVHCGVPNSRLKSGINGIQIRLI